MLAQGALEGQSKGRAAHKCQEMFRHRDGVRVEVETCGFARGHFADAKTAFLYGLGPARGLGLACTWSVFRPGFKYSKAEVMLLNLCQPGEYTDDLFAVSQPADAYRVMSVLDQINGRWGRGTLRSASLPANPDWAMRRELMSQSYTTRLDQLWRIHCS